MMSELSRSKIGLRRIYTMTSATEMLFQMYKARKE